VENLVIHEENSSLTTLSQSILAAMTKYFSILEAQQQGVGEGCFLLPRRPLLLHHLEGMAGCNLTWQKSERAKGE
jgi:hypothetical protein